MDRDDKISYFLKESKYDVFLKEDKSIKDSNMYYLTGIKLPDPAVYLHTGEKSILMVYRNLELERAKKEAEVDEVLSSNQFSKDSFQSLVSLLNEHGAEKLAVTEDFELGMANRLIEEGFSVEVIYDYVMEQRKQKNNNEIEKIRNTQKVTEKAMKLAEKKISEAKVKKQKLFLNGNSLTSTRLKSEIEKFLIDHNCRNPEGMIVTSGIQSGQPHKRESGEIKADEPIIVDIFPQHKSMYFGDMTRTFVKGNVSDEIQNMKDAVLEAQEKAFEVLQNGAGIKAREIHEKVCSSLEKKGYPTLRSGAESKGFIHSTGHAVGLDLHEPPKIAENEDELKEGMILTIEPGLYNPEIGGLRLEDMILVKENGYENFNSMQKNIQI